MSLHQLARFKLLALSGITAVGFAAAAAPSTVWAADGTITFTGHIVAGTCAATVSTTGAKDGEVKLGQISGNSLNAQGKTSPDQAFQITLTNCAGGGSVSAFFDGRDKTQPDGRLNTGVQNVEIELDNGDSSQIDLHAAKDYQSQKVKIAAFTTGTASMPFKAHYYATGVAGSGSITVPLDYTIVYP